MLEWLGYILARTIAGVLVALIVAILLNNGRTARTAGTVNAAL